VYVQRPIYDEFVSRVSEFADSLRVGNSLDPETQIGPIVSQAQLDRVTGYLDIGKEEGARPTAGGARLVEGDLAKGYFVPPTVFADVKDEMRIANEEIFGPVASVLPFDDIDEVARRVTGYLDIGKEEGARATAGGARLVEGDLAKGYFVPPTVFADVKDEMRIANEEIFGPVASVLPFDDIDEVARRANLTQFGLGGGVWTRDVGKAHRIAHSIKTGMVWVNAYGQMDPSMPLVGVKMSGWGSELSVHSLDEYLNIKAVWINTAV